MVTEYDNQIALGRCV